MRTLIFFVLACLNAHADNRFEALGLCADAKGDFSAIRKLVCESTPALVEAATGKTLPTCSSQSGPRLISGNEPVSAVFVACTATTKESCLNVAREIAKTKSGATINVLVTQSMLRNDPFLDRLSSMLQTYKSELSPMNVIPIQNTELQFVRDPMTFETGPKGAAYKTLPYDQVPKTQLPIDEAMQSCGIPKADETYNRLKGFDRTYARLSENEINPPANVGSQADFGATMGGNFLALPNGTVLVGKTPQGGLKGYPSGTKNSVRMGLRPTLKAVRVDGRFRASIVPHTTSKLCPTCTISQTSSISQPLGALPLPLSIRQDLDSLSLAGDLNREIQ